jgi:hypothetical protein
MSTRHLPKSLFSALAVALLLFSGLAFAPNLDTASAQSANGPLTLKSCDPPTQRNATSGATTTGLDPAAVSSDNLPDQALIPLWCAHDRSSENSPAVTTPSGCTALVRAIVMEFSGRGLDWVC